MHVCHTRRVFFNSLLLVLSVAVFRGHRNASFYVKSSVSPDDQFLASGSSDGQAYIWKVRRLRALVLLFLVWRFSAYGICVALFTDLNLLSVDL